MQPLCRGGIEGIGSRARFGGGAGAQAHLFRGGAAGGERPRGGHALAARPHPPRRRHRTARGGHASSMAAGFRGAGRDRRGRHDGPRSPGPLARRTSRTTSRRSAPSGARAGPAQVACFDTAFHRTMPRLAADLRDPARTHRPGLVRYGFHGLSISTSPTYCPASRGREGEGQGHRRASRPRGEPVRLHGGRSVATTMGFTALDGMMMGMRGGAIDAGLVLHLIEAARPRARGGVRNPERRSGCLVSPVSATTRATCWPATIPGRPRRSTCSPTAWCARPAR